MPQSHHTPSIDLSPGLKLFYLVVDDLARTPLRGRRGFARAGNLLLVTWASYW